ncbi:MAG: aldehyde dehydrogenase family protein, partial [Pedococcus sp.]
MSETKTSPTYQITNPATGEVEKTFDTATDAEVEAALDSAHAAYTAWKDVPIEERAKVVHRIAELFVERKDALGAIATREMGKPLSEAVGEAEFSGEIFDYFANEGPTLAADQPIKTFSGGKAVVQKLPIGPLLGIMPWNYPFYQIARFAAPNLMLGNTVILKHAESVPGSALAVAQLLKDAGVPDGAYVNVFATHDQVETIIADPRIAGVSLTGSERAGAVVASIAGKNLKKCVLELGGSDPYVILDTDDAAAAADTAWETRIGNTGQACNSNKRMIVMDDVFDGFVARLTEHDKDLRPGDPAAEEEGTFAPLSSRAAAEKLAEQVKDAVDKGATLHAGGVLGEGPAAYYSPAVLTGITKEMRAYGEELFGPVAVVYKVSGDDEALTLANDTTYGLGGAVFSTDTKRAEK